jgi:predicted ester cyclase
VRTRENKDLVVRLIEEVWNAGALDMLPELWADQTRGEATAMRDILINAFPDLHVEIDDLIAEDDRVVARLSFNGTHRGDSAESRRPAARSPFPRSASTGCRGEK